MTKVEMEKPVVSEKLAKDYERFKTNYGNGYELYSSHYKIAEEYGLISEIELERNLARMYVLGYEIEKPKFKYIRLNSNKLGCNNYLNLDVDGSYILSDKDNHSEYRTQFTQSEVDDFLKDEPEGMWIVEEVEDQ